MARVRPPTEERLDDERCEPQALQSLSADRRRKLTTRRPPQLLRIIQEKARRNLAAVRAEGKIFEAARRVSAEAASQQVESRLPKVDGPQRLEQIEGRDGKVEQLAVVPDLTGHFDLSQIGAE